MVQRRGMKMVKGQKNLPYRERHKMLSQFNLEKWSEIEGIGACKYLHGKQKFDQRQFLGTADTRWKKI